MTENKIYIIDLDDTLSNFLESWISLYNFMYDDNKKITDIKDWNVTQYLNKCEPEELYGLLKTPNFFRNVGAKNFARKAIQQLKDNGNTVKIVTAYPFPNSVVDKVHWLNEFMGIGLEDIIFTLDKTVIKGDYIIDDYIKNIKDFDGTRILFSSPHNEHLVKENGFDIRVNSWKEFLEFYAE